MKLALGWVALAVAIFLSLIFQEFLPGVQALYGAHIIFVPMLFCYGTLVLPTWAMVLLAAFTGFLTDLMYLRVAGGQVEIALGWSIVFFVVFGLLAHGFQPAFQRGHWWIHLLLAAAGTSAFLALQYAMISFRRHGFVFNDIVAWRIFAPGLIAAVCAPVLHLLVVQLDHFLPTSLAYPRGYRSH